MSENAWAIPDRGGPVTPPPVVEPMGEVHGALSLKDLVEREEQRLADGLTMAEWLTEAQSHPIDIGVDDIVRIIREHRDADDPREVA